MSLKEILVALKPKQALLHYNIATLEQFKAGVEAVKETAIPLIFGVSEGERNYLSPRLSRELVSEYSGQLPFFLNADHSKSVESAQEAIDANFDAVLFDGSEFSLSDNILRTKAVVGYNRRLDNNSRPQALIEGELGYLPGSSDLESEIEVKPEFLTQPEEAEKFVAETEINLLAISVGNIHGIPTSVKHTGNIKNMNGHEHESARLNVDQTIFNKAQLNFTRIQGINTRLAHFKSFNGLVLHGGSGLEAEDFLKAIQSGIKIIHLNTEFRQIWKESLIKELNQKTVVPYKIYQGVIEALKARIVYYQKLFWA